MREILFRGKRLDNGEWVEGHYVTRKSEPKSYIVVSTIGANKNTEINNMIATAFEVNPETVGQFTGLTDKNGNKIFEGDILKAGNGHIGYVAFSEGGFVLVCRYHSNLTDLHGAIQEVIGNIHDNPELLKGE